MKKQNLFIYCSFILFFAFISCGEKGNSNAETGNDTATALENVKTNLPDSIGADLVRSNCIVCHSLRYIEMQPDFPKKTWIKIVDKMKKTFGAPISDSAAALIVDYLVRIKS